MMFLDSPSPIAPVSEWLKWVQRLEKLDPHDATVIAEKARSQRLLKLLQEEDAADQAVVRV
jgi:hypothetical protein